MLNKTARGKTWKNFPWFKNSSYIIAWEVTFWKKVLLKIQIEHRHQYVFYKIAVSPLPWLSPKKQSQRSPLPSKTEHCTLRTFLKTKYFLGALTSVTKEVASIAVCIKHKFQETSPWPYDITCFNRDLMILSGFHLEIRHVTIALN